MKQAILSAMLAVRRNWRIPYFAQIVLWLTNPRIGLYFKLHGTHRPVAMKKQEIKRRKRVVPAAPGDGNTQTASVASHSPPQRLTRTPVFEHSVSPDPSTAIETSEDLLPEPKGPIPVDFTSYYSSTAPISHPGGPPTPSDIQPRAPSPKKRSLSATLDPEETTTPVNPVPHRPNDISSILNHPTNPTDPNIDPSLSVMPRKSAGPSPVPGARQEDKAARKERLRREAEAMRQELARKQKELEELDAQEE